MRIGRYPVGGIRIVGGVDWGLELAPMVVVTFLALPAWPNTNPRVTQCAFKLGPRMDQNEACMHSQLSSFGYRIQTHISVCDLYEHNKPKASCIDTTNGATDSAGDGCTYYASYQHDCSFYDDTDFSSNAMCCSCGGGTQAGEASLMIRSSNLN